MSKKEKGNSHVSFERICSMLDFSRDRGLLINTSDTDEFFLKNLLADTIKKLEIDAIFCIKPETTGPSAPVIYFKLMDQPSPEKIAELHKLSWNLGQAPLLFIVLPDKVLVYNTLEPPQSKNYRAGLIAELKIFSQISQDLKEIKEFERSEFETGNYWRRNVKIFSTKNSVFKKLLKNLEFMQDRLINSGLPQNIVHSLLVRSIFIKYLEDRRDSQGNGVFPADFFSIFHTGACGFIDLLGDKTATYNFFRYLDSKFNGDIFVLEDNEEQLIKQAQLDLLSRMLQGDDLGTGQAVLWPLYSFDVIPIELISSIYEQFFRLQETDKVLPKGIHYTPYHLVSFLLEEVLPLSDMNTDVKIIDPACGSGIFLVESFRRIVCRWINRNNGKHPNASQLIKLLGASIHGVDLDEKAIRVAALSLYLTLCDYLEPKTIWTDVHFEPLLAKNLYTGDFFDESLFSQAEFDLVLGNPPWDAELTLPAVKYVTSHFKPIGDTQICQAFLWKSADVCKLTGKVCMIVSSKALLFNTSKRNLKFRARFFNSYTIESIFNFSALRRSLFSHAVGPSAAIIFKPIVPQKEEIIQYYSPKPSFTLQDEMTFIIEPQDFFEIPLEEALRYNVIWKTAMWGTPRDFEIIKKLLSYPSLQDIANKRKWIFGDGYIVGNKKIHTTELLGKLEVVPKNIMKYTVNEKSLEANTKTDFERWRKDKIKIYEGPHVLIKQSPNKNGIISALMLKDAIFSSRILGIHATEEELSNLIVACEAINSDIPTYFAMMTASSWLVERDDLINEETLSFPIPEEAFDRKADVKLLHKLSTDEGFRFDENNKLLELYGFDASAKTLVADKIKFTLDYFRRKGNAIALQPADEEEVKAYMETLCAILNGEFSSIDKHFSGCYYVTKGPLRVVTLSLDLNTEPKLTFEQNGAVMDQLLKELDQQLIEKKEGSIYIRRHIWRYGKDSVTIIKPNQKWHWSKSSALTDSDKIFADIMSAWRRTNI